MKKNKHKKAKKEPKVKVVQSEDQCYSAPPPWRVKTKEQAWRVGNSSGLAEGYRQARQEFESKTSTQRLSFEELQIRQKALADICRAGSMTVEAMSLALRSYDKQL